MNHEGWVDLAVPPHELRLVKTLENGQCFEWRRVRAQSIEEVEYAGVIGERLIGFRETSTSVWYKQHWPVSDESGAATTTTTTLDAFVRDYLSLPHTCPVTGTKRHETKVLADLYPKWSQNATSHFQQVARVFPGVRLLRQDPITTLFSFLASSNNNVARITQMLHQLRKAYGTRLDLSPECRRNLVPYAGKTSVVTVANTFEWYTFPTLDSLCGATEARLRELGFGYRAPYVTSTAALVKLRGGSDWLASLRTDVSRDDVEKQLLACKGVGPKVAACVALFSLDQLDVVPIDTHMWQIALRDYGHSPIDKMEQKGNTPRSVSDMKSLTGTNMRLLGDVFRRLFGSMAGWAHCLLFLAELGEFKRQLQKRSRENIDDESSTPASKRRLDADAKA